MKIRTVRPQAPEVDPRRTPAMERGPADVVRARSLVGNAAVRAALGGLPRGAEPTPSGWAGQMLAGGQDLVGNQTDKSTVERPGRAAKKADAAQAAAVPPADDREARCKAAHAEDMDEADKFGESGKAEEVKEEVQGKVGEGKESSAREIADTTAAVPEPAPDAKEVVPMAPDKVPGKPGVPNPNQAAPDALPRRQATCRPVPRRSTSRWRRRR